MLLVDGIFLNITVLYHLGIPEYVIGDIDIFNKMKYFTLNIQNITKQEAGRSPVERYDMV